jgi:hypothetical protein
MNHSLLARIQEVSLFTRSDVSPIQRRMEDLTASFLEEAVNPSTLAALTLGGLAYRLGRAGLIVAGEGLVGKPREIIRFGSILLGTGFEVGTFEGVHRSFSSLSGKDANPNTWQWKGRGGWAEGLSFSFISFGVLKGFGFLARDQNIILQHAFQSSAMVAGHQVAGHLGVVASSDQSFAEQLLFAEATNLQMQAGAALALGLFPTYHALTHGLDLSSRLRALPPNSIFPFGEGGRIARRSLAGLVGEEDIRDFHRPTLPSGLKMSPIDPPENGGPKDKEGPVPGGSGERSSAVSDQKVSEPQDVEADSRAPVTWEDAGLQVAQMMKSSSGAALQDVQELRRQMLTWARLVKGHVIQRDIELRFHGSFSSQTVEGELNVAIHRIHSLQSYLLVPTGRRVTLVYESETGEEKKIHLVRRTGGFERE